LLLSNLMLSRLRPSRQRLYSQLLFIHCPQSQPSTTKLAPPSVLLRRTIMTDIPSTLQGPPTASIVPPGQCQFGADAVSVPLKTRTKISPTTSVLRFGLPDDSKPLDLSTCACILATATINGESVTREFSSVS
jgi:Oxidoreductase FAD-binding domain